MNIVHIEEFFHPDAGYQVNLLARLQQAQGHKVTVIAAELERMPSFLTSFFGKENIVNKDMEYTKNTGVEILRVPLLGYWSGRAIFFPRLFKVVSSQNPDSVFVHGLDTFTGMVFICLSNILNYPIVLDCHMLEMASRNRFREYFRRFYKKLITPIIIRKAIPIIRVVDSDYVEKCLGIPLANTNLLSFGTDTVHFSPNFEVRKAVRIKLGINPNAFLVLYAGKLDETKGGSFLAESLNKNLISDDSTRPIVFLVIGSADGNSGEKLERLFSLSENKIVRLPTQRYFDLAQYYQAADIAVFPRQCSLSFFEAQSCGLPVLFEENEINNQRASNNNAFTFKKESVEDFRVKIIWLYHLPKIYFSEIGKNARNYVLLNYDYVPIAKKYTEILRDSVVNWKLKNINYRE